MLARPTRAKDASNEFEVQGLELDWVCVCWNANFLCADGAWVARQFKGTVGQNVADATRPMFIANSYRVLLTRAHQDMVIFVPRGDDRDRTPRSEVYDSIYAYLRSCGLPELDPTVRRGPGRSSRST